MFLKSEIHHNSNFELSGLTLQICRSQCNQQYFYFYIISFCKALTYMSFNILVSVIAIVIEVLWQKVSMTLVTTSIKWNSKRI